MRVRIQCAVRLSCFAVSTTIAVILTAGCTAGMVTTSLYEGPKHGPTSSVRFNVASYTTGHFNGMGIYVFGDEKCNDSEFGRFVGEVGRDKTLVSTKGNSIGMPRQAGYQDFTYIERPFRAGRPVVFSIVAHVGGPGKLCEQTYSLTPAPGELFEIKFDIRGNNRCEARVFTVSPTGSLTVPPIQRLRRLPNFCEKASLLN